MSTPLISPSVFGTFLLASASGLDPKLGQRPLRITEMERWVDIGLYSVPRHHFSLSNRHPISFTPPSHSHFQFTLFMIQNVLGWTTIRHSQTISLLGGTHALYLRFFVSTVYCNDCTNSPEFKPHERPEWTVLANTLRLAVLRVAMKLTAVFED